MSKLSLAVADMDELYISRIMHFLVSRYSNRFNVSTFTKQPFLIDFLSAADKKVDILLISPELFDSTVLIEKAETIILLCEGRTEGTVRGYDAVYKFQHGDMLVSNIISIFSKKDRGELFIKDGTKKTRVIAVYSPSGGSGKTSIAVGSSIQCAQKGLAVFYLNFEHIDSLLFCSNINRGQNLSNIIYHLKERSQNITLKIEGTRCIDSQYNISYFEPPDSIQELNELTAEDYRHLIQQFKLMGQYDIIFVDMSSSFDSCNIALLEESDEILLILAEDYASNVKARVLSNELNILFQKNSSTIKDKISIVLNKCSHNISTGVDDAGFNGKAASVRLPLCWELKASGDLGMLADMGNGFGRGINQLTDKLV